MDVEALISSVCEARRDTIFGYVPGLTGVFGVGRPPIPGRDPFVTWIKYLAQEIDLPKEHLRVALRSPAEFIDMLLSRRDAVILLIMNGMVDVYSRRRRPKDLPKQFLDKMERFSEIEPSTKVDWYQSTRSPRVPTVAAEVLYGMNPEDVAYEQKRAMPERPLSPRQKNALRRKFWLPNTYDPRKAPDIVDKLLQ